MHMINLLGRGIYISIVYLSLASSSLVLANEDFSALSSVISEEINRGGAPGASIAVVKDGALVYSRTFGIADMSRNRPMAADELFRSASTLKMMVGAVLAEQHVRGNLDLHAPISDHIKGLHSDLAKVTAHQLLTHTSGIIDTGGNGDTSPDALRLKAEALGNTEVFLPAGVAFSYSNPGYSLAGYLLEVIQAKPFRYAMDDLLFEPLAMERSTFELSEAEALGLAQPHRTSGDSFVTMAHRETGRGEEPSGTMFSSVEDYARFMIEFLTAYKEKHHQGVLSHETAVLMASPRVAQEGPVTSYSYSYGLMVGETLGYKSLFHSGGMPGYASNVLMLPDDGLGVVVFTNGENANRNRILEAAVKVFLPDQSGERAQIAREEHEPISADVGKRITGTYWQRADLPQIVISERDNKFILRNRGRDYILYCAPDGELYGFNDDGYIQRYRMGYDEEGQATHIQWWIRAFAKK